MIAVFAGLRAGGLLRRSVWGIADQAQMSASNFLTVVLLARQLDPSDFGAFTLAFMALLFGNSLQSALIIQPHNVLGATLRGDDYARYTTSTAISQVALTAAAGLLATVAAAVATVAAPDAAHWFWALVPAIVGWPLQEFVRGICYTEGRADRAFAIGLIGYGGQGLGVIALWQVGWLTGPLALYVVAGTSALAALWGFWTLRSRLRRASDAGALAENWRFGKWLVAATLTGWSSRELYPFLIAGLVSVAATGIFKAVQSVMGPTHILFRAMSASLTPGAAKVYAEGGPSALGSFTRRVCLLTAPPMLGYCLLVALFAEPLLDGLYGDRYRGHGWLLAALALVYAVVYFDYVLGIALQASGRSASIFQASLWSTLGVLTVGVAALHFLGLAGAALGLLAHDLISNVVLWRRYRQATEGG